MTRDFKTTIALSSISLAMSLSFVSNAIATPACSKRDKIVSVLATQYNEKPLHRGLTKNGSMVEVFSSSSGTFTLVVTMPTGVSCLLTAGKHWQKIAAKVQEFNGNIEREF